jgi:hypothetical protein
MSELEDTIKKCNTALRFKARLSKLYFVFRVAGEVDGKVAIALESPGRWFSVNVVKEFNNRSRIF